MVKQEDYNREIARLIEPDLKPPRQDDEFMFVHPFMSSMSPGHGYRVHMDLDEPSGYSWWPLEFTSNFETAMVAFDKLFPGEKLWVERDEYAWYAHDYIDDQHFGGGDTAAKAVCEMILRKSGVEVEDH